MRFVTKTQSAFLLLLDIANLEILWYSYWLKGDERMAKNRIIPFGYCMKSGEITVDFTESRQVVYHILFHLTFPDERQRFVSN